MTLTNISHKHDDGAATLIYKVDSNEIICKAPFQNINFCQDTLTIVPQYITYLKQYVLFEAINRFWLGAIHLLYQFGHDRPQHCAGYII